MKVLARKYVEKNSKRDEKIGFKTSLKSCAKLAKRTPFYRVQKLAIGLSFLAKMTRRSTGQRSFFRPLGLPVDRSVDRRVDRNQVKDLSVDRG